MIPATDELCLPDISLDRLWGVVDNVEGAGTGGKPAGVMHWSKGCRTVAGVGIEGDAVDRTDVGCVVELCHGAGAGGEWRGGDVGVLGPHDPRIVDVVRML